ncbi:MAG: hypothetical protein KIT85_05070 [Pseudolabrys sp.]|nr:hypothetical protein [Pseudolabrys sp.]
MWEWLPIAFGEPNALTKKMSSEECVSEAIRLLKSKNIWMHDTLTRVTRNQNMERMASDRSIRTPASNDFSDFKTIFSTHTKLVTIAATSQQAYKYLQTAMKLQGLASSNGYAELAAWSKSQPSNSAADETSFKIEKHVRPISKFDFEGRTLSIYLLPSPSGRYSNSGKLSAEIYRRVLTDEIPSKT